MTEENTEQTELDIDKAGWTAAAMYVLEVARQVSADHFEVIVIPDPEGENPSGEAGIFVQMISTEDEGPGGTMVIGYDVESLKSVREAIVVLSGRIYEAESRLKEGKKSKLHIPPEKKLIVPGE